MNRACYNVTLAAALMLTVARADFTPPLLATWNDLDAAASENDDGLTNWACTYPPGPFVFGVNAGCYTFAPEGELAAATNLFVFSPRRGVPAWTLQITETQAEERVLLYEGKDGVPFRTNAVPSSFDPQKWVRDAYGEPPVWLSSADLAEWYADRDRSRMRLELTLISASDWPLLEEAWMNAATNTPVPDNPPPTLPPDTNSLAFAGMENTSSNSMRLWVYTPARPVPIDIFSSAALSPTGETWSVIGTLEANSMFETWSAPASAGAAFFYLARADVDSDGDGISDSRERLVFGTDPHVYDSDGDGLSDRKELYQNGTNPNAVDSDGDGVWDGEDQSPLAPGPQITICSPQDGAALTNSPVLFSGWIVTSNGLDSVWVRGVRAEICDTGNGIYAFTNSLILDEGSNTIVVRALSADFVPLESKKNVTVTVDAQPPNITMLSPVETNIINGANVHVTVWTDSTNDTVTVNGCATTRDGYIRYAWTTLTAVGTNTISVVAVDSLNRAATNSVSVYCSDCTVTDPNDRDCDGVPDPEDPEPDNPSVRSTVVITSPPNGMPMIAW